MSYTEQFWNAASTIIAQTEKHPFLVAMVDGTLSLDKFRYYVIQDALYLTDFSQCLKTLSLQPNTPNDESTRLLQFSIGAEEEEKSLHYSFFRQWNIHDYGNEPPKPYTTLYTSYMMRIVATGTREEGLAVLLPCFWVYMHVGKCMLKLREEMTVNGVTRPPQFDAWIDMYASEEFEKEVQDYIALVEKYASNTTPEIVTRMQEHFLMSCKLEHMFWDQANDLMDWPNFGVVVEQKMENERGEQNEEEDCSKLAN